VKEVHCFTNGTLGHLPSNVSVTELSSHTLVKTRFVDRESGYPLFESKSADIEGSAPGHLPDFNDFDLVLIADFGHGLLDAAAINGRIANDRRSFVAAMAQVNSGNYGYNLPTKYRGADCYSLNRTEAELCLHERNLPLPELIDRVCRLLPSHTLSVTDGDQGAMVRKRHETYALPTLSTSVVDTIGCGDAYFALSSVAACLDFPANLVALTGSIGGAAMSQRRGNDRPITEQDFMTIAKIVI
jgi:bifunctional ADP-heptose synthase (sugar kinase/adenylyltransferase)